MKMVHPRFKLLSLSGQPLIRVDSQSQERDLFARKIMIMKNIFENNNSKMNG